MSTYRRDLTISGGVALGVFLLLLYTSSCLPFTWDEGAMAYRSEMLSFWFQRVTKQIPLIQKTVPMTPELENVCESDSLEILFSLWVLESYCYSEEGHPGFPVFLNAFGQAAAPSFLPFKTRFRFGNLCFFSLALGAVFFRLKKDFGTKTAVFGILTILFIPRLFTHAQIAHYDSPLTAVWLLSWACFPYALKSEKGAFLFGSCVGLTVASKFPGIGVLLPPLLWITIRLTADRFAVTKNRLDCCLTDLLKRACMTIFTALFVFWLFNPRLWLNPIAGMEQFIYLNTHRTLNITALFFGTMYDLYHSLPWYNTIAWTMITVPIGILMLFFVGTATMIRDQDKRWQGLWIFLNMSVLLVVRALPGTPVHDGVRLFIPAFAFLAIIAAVGAVGCEKWKMRKMGSKLFLLPILIYCTCLFNMFWYAPQWLSFYNLAIGGLPGAVRAGMEPTYYWDGLDDEIFAWIKSNVKNEEKIAFSSHSDETLQLCFSEKDIRVPFEIAYAAATFGELKNKQCRYYVLQRRLSAVYDRDKRLTKRSRPVFTKTIRKGGWGPWNLGSVPIVEIYDLNSE